MGHRPGARGLAGTVPPPETVATDRVTEHDGDDRVRRLSAAMRFLSQMHGIATEADLIQAMIQAAAVWYDLDARAYRRDLAGRDVLEMWLPGAELEGDPKELTSGALVTADRVTRVNSLADFEQLGWHNAQREVMLLPIAPNGQITWLLAVPGAIDADVEATLALVCRTGASVLEQLSARRAREVCDRLIGCLAGADGQYPREVEPVAQAVLSELLSATGAVRGSLAIRRRLTDNPVVLAALGDHGPGGPRVDQEAGQPVLSPGRLAMALGLGGGADALMDLGASAARPFGVADAAVAGAGASVVGAWLAGVAVALEKAPVSERPEESSAPPFERRVGEELGRAKRMRLKGGVVVVRVVTRGEGGQAAAGAVPADVWAQSLLIQALRAELRSSDLLGQLCTGELAALLVRANADGVASAEKRLKLRIDRLSREHRLPRVAVGTALYPPAEGETSGMLFSRARGAAAVPAEDPTFFN
jgi:hypothetical protein